MKTVEILYRSAEGWEVTRAKGKTVLNTCNPTRLKMAAGPHAEPSIRGPSLRLLRFNVIFTQYSLF